VETGHFVNKARTLAKFHSFSPEPSHVQLLSASLDPSDAELAAPMATAKRGRGFFADQFENSANWLAHFRTTGPEIFSQCGGKLDAFVAGAGTGGTISGVALFLKPRLPGMTIVLADPQGSGLYNRVRYGVMFDAKEREGTRRRRQVDSIVEGIGINRVTANFEAGRELVGDAVRVTDAQAVAMARWLVEKDGIFVGSSSAVNCRHSPRSISFLDLPHLHSLTAFTDFCGTRFCSRKNSIKTRTGPSGGDSALRLWDTSSIKILGQGGGRRRFR